MIDILALNNTIIIGKQGENNARRVKFDIRSWMDEFGSGSPQLIVQMPDSPGPYPVDCAIENGYAVWTVTN